MSNSIRERDLPVVTPSPTDMLRIVRNGGSVQAWAGDLPLSASAQAQINSLVASQGSGLPGYPTLASLPGGLSSPDTGRLFAVTNDPTPANNGTWRWDGAAYVLSADRVTDLSSRVAVTEGNRGPGVTELFLSPNVYTDETFALLAAGGGNAADGSGYYFHGPAAAVTPQVGSDGRRAVEWVTSGSDEVASLVRWRAPLERVGVTAGQYVSASMRVLEAAVNTNARILLRQLTAGGDEITAARQLYTFAAGAYGNVLVRLGPVAVDAAAASVEFYIDSPGAGTRMVLCDWMMAAGRVTDYRPPVLGHIVTPPAMTAAVAAGTVESVQRSSRVPADAIATPNMLSAGSFDFTELGPVISGGPVTVESLAGVKAWKLTHVAGSGSERSIVLGPFPAARFTSGKYSASLDLVKAQAAAGGGVRLLIQQFNASNAEISGARQTVQFSSGAAAEQNNVSALLTDITLDPACTSVRFYVAVLGNNSVDRSIWFRNPCIHDGSYTGLRVPSASAPKGVAYVSPTGSDAATGGAASPLATIDAALRLIGGNGTIFLLPGTYGPSARVTPGLVAGNVRIVGVRSNLSAGDYDWPVVILGDKATGITKTAGRTKVYQATVAGLPTLANFQWVYQHGAADPTTEIDEALRFPQHRGRTYRLPWCARLHKTVATILADALAEIDASATPKAFIDSGVLYFSIVGGGDATAAEIYLDAASGLVAAGTRGAAGALSIKGLRVMYGGVSLIPFRKAEVDELVVVGSRVNALEYNVLRYGTLEVCCGGAQSALNGDGLNGHTGAVLLGEGDLYTHDNWDDGFSDHEGCSSRLLGGGLSEYNGGGGVTPAYGSDSICRAFVSVRNQQRGTFKAAAFYVTGTPGGATPPESGADTNAVFHACTDFESRTSFADDYSGSGSPVYALCIDCKSIRPVTRGYNVRKVIDCGYVASGTSSARNAATIVENTTGVT